MSAPPIETVLRLHAAGDINGAIAQCRKILAGNPGNADALNLLGVFLAQTGGLEEGLTHLGRAVEVAPDNPSMWLNLGLMRNAAGDAQGAFEALQRAYGLPHEGPEITRALAELLIQTGNGGPALQVLWDRLQIRPDDHGLWLTFAEVLRQSAFDDLDDPGPLLTAVTALLDRPGLDHQHLAAVSWAVVSASEPVRSILAAMDEDDDTFDARIREPATWEALSSPHLRAMISRCVVPQVACERLLTRLRRHVLLAVTAKDDTHPVFDTPELACALALQCWLNGFVFHRTSDEERRAHALAESLLAKEDAEGNAVGLSEPADTVRLAVLACYDSLIGWGLAEDAVALTKQIPFEPFIDVLMRQVAEPLDEEEIRATLPSLTEIREGVSAEVRAQYEEHPYPRWVSLDAKEPKPAHESVAERFPWADVSALARTTVPDILVAGCGTGKHLAQVLYTYHPANVIGVDLSRASLAYGTRMLGELGLTGVELYHADLLELGNWDRRFDLIECSGVLHHMEEPMDGWRVLNTLLRPGGFMKISLYSELARQNVAAAREMIREGDWNSTPGSIREFRKQVMDGTIDLPGLMIGRDFFMLEECRDLIFHVQEHRFTIPRLQECVDELGLEFIGFDVKEGVRLDFLENRSPEDLRSFEAWDRFEHEKPDTFVAMYQFWLQKPA